jgi:diacylglycerol kinase family enzyme
VTHAVVESEGAMEFHVDGELGSADRRIEVKLLPAALKVRVAR